MGVASQGETVLARHAATAATTREELPPEAKLGDQDLILRTSANGVNIYIKGGAQDSALNQRAFDLAAMAINAETQCRMVVSASVVAAALVVLLRWL